MADILDAYRLTAQIEKEPFIISGLTRASMQQSIHQTIWESLRKRVFTAAQLKLLQEGLHKAYLTDQLIIGINTEQYHWTINAVT